MTLDDIIKDNGLEEVESLDGGEMYSWSTTEIYFQRSSGRFFGLSDGGCSCNYFGDGVSGFGDFTELTRAVAIEWLRDERGAFDISDDDVSRETAKVRDFR